MELKREVKSYGSLVPVTFAAAVVVIAIACVQRTRVPASVEIAVRMCAAISGVLAVPALLFFAFRDWITKWRMKLPEWRNGLGLSSLVLVSLIWASRFVTSTVSNAHRLGNSVFHVDQLSWLATLLYSTLLAALLAFALKGKARILAFSSVLFLWSGIQSGIYF
jgi:hypothetical protein